MSKPVYPTQEGLWSEGKRTDAGYDKVRLGMPYPAAVASFRRATRERDDFDSATLLVWGTMQATAVLNILKAAEESFGEAGQVMVRRAINAAGYEAMKGFMEGSEFPEDMNEIDLISFIVTGLNTVLYASLERPRVVSDSRCEFDILWCPHQDRYSAFDCRVQRYFVEGMFNALEELGKGAFTARVEELIPRGGACCRFVVEKIGQAGRNPWHEYSDTLERRALEKQRREEERR